MVFFVLRKLILQTRMRSHPVGLDVWFLVRPFVYFHTLCVRIVKALAWLRICAAFAGCLCDKYHNLMSWLIYVITKITASQNHLIIWKHTEIMYNTIKIISFGTDRSGQIAQTQIRLTLIRVYIVCCSFCIIQEHNGKVKPHCSNLSLVTRKLSSGFTTR